jgi:hypothetical protein
MNENEMSGGKSKHGKVRHVYSVLDETPEERRPLGIPACIWEDNIKMNLREIRCEGVEWIHLAQNRDRNHVRVIIFSYS